MLRKVDKNNILYQRNNNSDIKNGAITQTQQRLFENI